MSAFSELRLKILKYAESCPEEIRLKLQSLCGHSELKQHPKYPGYFVGRDGIIIGPSGKLLRHFSNPDGYPAINVIGPGGRHDRRQVRVHVMVCETYHGIRPPEKDLVAHSDGNILNCHADNLRWATYLENEADKTKHGTRKTCERHPKSKLNSVQVRAIRAASGLTHKQLAEAYGVSTFAIGCVRRRQTWKELPD